MDVDSSLNGPLDMLAADYIERRRAGERVDVETYARALPHLATEIRDLFPAISAIEKFKQLPAGNSRNLGNVPLERLGDYQLIRELGRGGMGIVYEAEQVSLSRRVALKILPKQDWVEDKQRRRFQREARTAGQLHHTNIVPVLGVGEHNGFAYYVMQLIDGVGLDRVIRHLANPGGQTSQGVRTFANALLSGRFADTENHHAGTNWQSDVGPRCERLESNRERENDSPSGNEKRNTKLTGLGQPFWKSVAGIGVQVADALHYAHGQGTLHRDIKPANLLMDQKGVTWVADFGLAKAGDQEPVSVDGDVVGTLRYMAPEQLEGSSDERTDLYALGLTLYELITLKPAFKDHRRHRREPIPPRKINARVPRDLETIVLKAIASSPNIRYQSATDMAYDLRCFLQNKPIQARRASATDQFWKWCRRNPALAASGFTTATALALLAVVSTVGFVLTQQANRKANDALWAETIHRREAENTATLAADALDAIFQRFTPTASMATGSSRQSLAVDNAITDGSEISIRSEPVLSRETAGLLEQLLEFYDKLAAKDGSDADLYGKIADAHRRVGDIRLHLGHNADAIRSYQKTIELLENSPALADPPRQKIELARLHSAMGVAHRNVQQANESDSSFEAALTLLNVADAEFDTANPTLLFELARTLYLQNCYDDTLVPHRPSPRRRREVLMSRSNHRFDLISQAKLRRAVRILDQLAERVDPKWSDFSAQRRLLLASCLRDLAKQAARRDRIESIPLQRQAIDILEELVHEEPARADYRFELAATMGLVQPVRPGQPTFRKEATNTMEALNLIENLVAQHPQVPIYQQAYAQLLDRMGKIHFDNGEYSESLGKLRTANAVVRNLTNQFPESSGIAALRMFVKHSLARGLLRSGKRSAANKTLRAAVIGFDGQDNHAPHERELFPVVSHSYRMLADLAFESRQFQDALVFDTLCAHYDDLDR